MFLLTSLREDRILFQNSLSYYDESQTRMTNRSGKSRSVHGFRFKFTLTIDGEAKEMSREELIGLIQSDAKFMDERDDIAAYIDTLEVGKGLDEKAIRDGYERFKEERNACQLAVIADKHGLETAALQGFVDNILRRMIFDGEKLSDLFAPQGLGWKARTQKELTLMEDLIPLLHKFAQGREISGLGAYEQ